MIDRRDSYEVLMSTGRMLPIILLGVVLATGAVSAEDAPPPEGSAAQQTRAQDAAATPISEAERTLWLGNQLAAVTAPMTLEYTFTKSGSLEAGFTDTVRFNIHKVKPDGMKAASLEFFTGERRFPVPPEENTDVNPVLKVYFQGDVYEMNRLSDPEGTARERWRYFQRRIKFALAEAATVEPAEIRFDGRAYPGKRIHFQPYLNDPKRSEFEKFANKEYTVLVSDALPGFVYRIETRVADATAGAPPLLQEVLELTAIRPLDAAQADASASAPR